MNKVSIAFCVVLSIVAFSGCQIDSQQEAPEVIDVSNQLSSNAHYNIDLTRDDAVFHLAPNIDVSRLSVTDLTRSVIPFTEYVERMILPAGVDYDPAASSLELANAAVHQEFLSSQVCVVGQRCDANDNCTPVIICISQ